MAKDLGHRCWHGPYGVSMGTRIFFNVGEMIGIKAGLLGGINCAGGDAYWEDVDRVLDGLMV